MTKLTKEQISAYIRDGAYAANTPSSKFRKMLGDMALESLDREAIPADPAGAMGKLFAKLDDDEKATLNWMLKAARASSDCEGVVVPREPTHDMRMAASRLKSFAFLKGESDPGIVEIYKAMLAAAPQENRKE